MSLPPALLSTASAPPPSPAQGATITFELQGGAGASLAAGSSLEVYTTRPDTLFGATYMVVAPEHPLLRALASGERGAEVEAYAAAAARKSDLERTELQKGKTGVFTGVWWGRGGVGSVWGAGEAASFAGACVPESRSAGGLAGRQCCLRCPEPQNAAECCACSSL